MAFADLYQRYEDEITELYKVKAAGQKSRDMTPQESAAVCRYLDMAEGAINRGTFRPSKSTYVRPGDAEDALKEVVDRYDLDADVEAFEIGDYDGPYGSQTLGWQLVPKRHHLDLYDDRLVWMFHDNGDGSVNRDKGAFEWTDWGSTYESWEEDQRNRDPWPQLESDGPDNGPDEQLFTDDHIHFFDRYKPGWNNQKPEIVFTVDWGEDDDADNRIADWWEAFAYAHTLAELKGGYGYYDYFWSFTPDFNGSYDLVRFDKEAPDMDSKDREAFERGAARAKGDKDLLDRQLVFQLVDMGAGYQLVPWEKLFPGSKPIRTGPRVGDLFATYNKHVGITVYRLGPPRALPKGYTPYTHGPPPGMTHAELFNVAPPTIKNDTIWRGLADALFQLGTKSPSRIWFGQPFSEQRSWRLVLFDRSMPRAPPGFEGIRRRRRA
jgi:hypothetical protein